MAGSDPMTWKDYVTLGAALVGATLGVMNTWNAMSQRRIRLRVRPAYAIGVPHGQMMFSIEVINLGAFPVTVTEVGFTIGRRRLGKGVRAAISMPIVIDGGKWPRRLEPREAVSTYFDPGQLTNGRGTIGRAYVRTACEETAYGTSPALKQLRARSNA